MAGLNVVIIGSGNLAWHLAALIANAQNIKLTQIVSRNELSADFEPYLNGVQSTQHFSNLMPDADIYFLAVSDDAISPVSTKLLEYIKNLDVVVAHLSGSLPESILHQNIANRGVWYPLQSFTKGREVNWSEIPCFVCGNSDRSVSTLFEFSKLAGLNAMEISAEEKLHLHLSAVVLNNFVNHLLTLSRDYLLEHSINPDHLQPLMLETFRKAVEVGPENVQTGPARRMDRKVIDKHLELLKENQKLAEIYQLLSDSIYLRYRS